MKNVLVINKTLDVLIADPLNDETIYKVKDRVSSHNTIVLAEHDYFQLEFYK